MRPQNRAAMHEAGMEEFDLVNLLSKSRAKAWIRSERDKHEMAWQKQSYS